MTSALLALAQIISDNVRDIDNVYTQHGLSYPTLNEPNSRSEFPWENDSSLLEKKKLIIAAAAQLIATVHSPVDILKQAAASAYMTAAVGFAADIGLANVLKDVDREGMHINSIAAITNIDVDNLRRVLRYLTTRHIFRELSEDVFVNNNVSSLLVGGAAHNGNDKDSLTRYDDAPVLAHVSLYADEGFHSAVALSPFLRKRDISTTVATPFNMVYKTDLSLFEWFNQPENAWRARRFAAAMTGNAKRFPDHIISDGIGMQSLAPGDVIVDVGGGVGSATLQLYKSFPHQRYIVQDLEEPIRAARKYWNKHAPEALVGDSVKLQVQSFFDPQPAIGAKVYFLRIVTHDWNDTEVRSILANLRAVADKETKLVLFETITRCSCVTSQDQVPYPLLGNLGVGGAGVDTAVNLHMLSLLTGRERTESDFRNLGLQTGWILQKINPGILASISYLPAQV
ncbi:S-adenosyl-L-methionine-dependent methyltransferase [Dendrothele bispora CBS 962.96]|uniref:S-adenosyl-L-methionine-dependent methyltransferase n=1 Tax=Dendrothele bispora (strain CBS 962.96) TaxID=1314807 RepID=A0A4S8MAJ5_DENBC|nr:S-adenosyl-L-methionine-dependent methyltransferase [Dendrothele bispora CBS 962.96]